MSRIESGKGDERVDSVRGDVRCMHAERETSGPDVVVVIVVDHQSHPRGGRTPGEVVLLNVVYVRSSFSSWAWA